MFLHYYCGKFPAALHFRQHEVRLIGKDIPHIHVFTESRKEKFWLAVQALTAEQVFRFIPAKTFFRAVVQAVPAPEIRYTAFRRDACTAKKDNMLCFPDDPVKSFDLLLFG